MDISHILKNTLLIIEDTTVIYKKDINIKSKKMLKKDKAKAFMKNNRIMRYSRDYN